MVDEDVLKKVYQERLEERIIAHFVFGSARGVWL